MEDKGKLTFPPLLLFVDFDGIFESYFNASYKIFENDFIKSHPIFCKLNVTAKRIPLVDGIHKTFYHITHEGDDESDRKPDIRRIERIRFIKFCIINSISSEFKIWESERGRDIKTVIFHEEEKYVVVLTNRYSHYLLTTAYFVEQDHRLNKLKKEYTNYLKSRNRLV